MKGNYKFGLGLLVVVMLLIALIQASQKQPIDWSKTFNPKDKIPFGTYVIRQELENIFDTNELFKPINTSLFLYLTDSLEQDEKKYDLIFIGEFFHPGKTALQSLLSFVKDGNNALLACQTLPQMLSDTLHFKIDYFNSYQAGLPFSDDSVYYNLAAGRLSARYNKNPYQTFFSKLNDTTTTILGHLKRGNMQLPNFIKVQFGKGYFYCQLTPDVYSNYFMLNPETYPLAYASLHHLRGRHILWYSGSLNAEKSHTPLRFVLSSPPLRAAWYLLLAILLLYIIFKSKREQKAIPIVKPEENMSVAFAETIGALYYENGHPGNMIQKKVNYFLYKLKKKYRFDEMNIENARFRKTAADSIQLSGDEINDFFDRLGYYQKLQEPTLTDLKIVQNIIEDFKQKIKLT